MLNASIDQADGLRRLFTPVGLRFLPCVDGAPGVGHTTVLTWLAAALANSGKRVLLIDGARGRLARTLGHRPRYELLDVLSGDQSFEDVALPHASGVSVLPAARGLRMMAEGGYGIDSLYEPMAGAERRYDCVWILAEPQILGPLFAGTAAEPFVLTTVRADAMTAAYAAIKTLKNDYGLSRFWLTINQAADEREALQAVMRLCQCARRFCSAEVRPAEILPYDTELRRSFPSPAAFSAALGQLAQKAAAWGWAGTVEPQAHGHSEGHRLCLQQA